MLAKRRIAETKEVAKRLGVSYDVLDNHDGELLPSLEIRLQIIRKIREWKADVVIAPRSNDYHPDHRYTGVLVQDAAFMVGVPNVAPDIEPLRKNPVFLYFQDNFKKPNPFQADIAVDITPVIEKKIAGLDAHQSQFYEWLPWVGNYEEEVPKDPAKYKAYLLQKRVSKPNADVQKSLEKWYGSARASKALYAEAFEICEYGTQPTGQVNPATQPYIGSTYTPPVPQRIQDETNARAAYDAKIAAERLAYTNAGINESNFDSAAYLKAYPEVGNRAVWQSTPYAHYLEANRFGDARVGTKLPFTPTPYAPTPLIAAAPAPAPALALAATDSGTTMGGKAGGLMSIKHRKRRA
jgi:hypothetical protein